MARSCGARTAAAVVSIAADGAGLLLIDSPMATHSLQPDRPAVIDLRPEDDLAALRHRMDRVADGRLALSLPWDLEFLSRDLDFDLLRREAERRQLQLAIVSPDPLRRQLARGCGFPAFATVDAAVSADRWNGQGAKAVDPPPSRWWEEEPDLHGAHRRKVPVWLRWAYPGLVARLKDGVRFLAFLLVIVVVAGSAYAIIPTAEVTVVPAGETITVRVPVSVDPQIEAATYTEDGLGAIIPSRRVGMEIEGYAQVETAELASVASGRATGEVLFTSILPQDYVVPAGTVVRTSSTSYPIRFRTMADVVVPADGQAKVPIRALDERTGNVGAYQINRVEGVAASAVRVINPQPTTGAEAKEVPIVAQADYDRVREKLTGELLDRAFGDLHELLEPDEVLPYESLRVEAVPKKAYTHFIGEESDTVGLNMRLLISGQAVSGATARATARRALIRRLPPGYGLVDAEFAVGDVIDREDGPGWFTFYVSGRGYAAARISPEDVVTAVRGQRTPDAREELVRAFPLDRPPQIETWPTWPKRLAFLDRVPVIPMRVQVHVIPEAGPEQAGVDLPPAVARRIAVRGARSTRI